MSNWVRHIENFVDLGEFQADGQVSLNCLAVYYNNLLQLNKLEYNVEQLAFDGYGTKIREPKISGTGTAVYDLTNGQLTVPETMLTSNAVVARGENLLVWYPDNLRIDGGVEFRGDVNRFADWYGLSPTPDSIFWFGSAEGNLQLASNQNGIGIRLTSTITDLVAAQRANQTPATSGVVPVANRTNWQELFREPRTELNSDLMLANDFNSFQFANLTIRSSALQVTGAGVISDLAQNDGDGHQRQLES